MADKFNVNFKNTPNLEDFKNDLPPMQSQEFDEHISIEQIKSLVYTLLTETDCERDDRLRKSKNYSELRGKYQKKYAGLQNIYPALYSMILEQGRAFDLVQFENFLEMADKVRNKNIDAHTADKMIGEQMVNKYVKPNLKN